MCAFKLLVAVAIVLVVALAVLANTEHTCDCGDESHHGVDSGKERPNKEDYDGGKSSKHHRHRFAASTLMDDDYVCKSSSNESICNFQSECGQIISLHDLADQVHVGIQLRGNGDEHFAYDNRCSGTMVTDKLLLTSRKCTFFRDGTPATPSSIRINVGPFHGGVHIDKKTTKVVRICRHKNVTSSNVFKRKELAMLELVGPIDPLKISCWPFEGLGVKEGELIRNHCVAIGFYDRLHGRIWHRTVEEETGFACHLTNERRLKSYNRCWNKSGKGGAPVKYPGAPILCRDASHKLVIAGVITHTTFASDNREEWLSPEAAPEGEKQLFIRYPSLATMIDPINDADLANYECTS